MTFDLDRYLARLGIERPGPGVEGLARLQAAQMASIPFENLDPLLGLLPDLRPERIWAKLLAGGRGGYCLELNAIFGQALAALGYDAVPILGRVRMGAAQDGPRAHLAWIVSCEGGEWLADCGFGGPAPRRPIAINATGQSDGAGCFRIRPDPTSGERVLERAVEDGWFALYGFDGVRPWPVDIEAANVVCSRWEQSPFPGNLLVTRLTPDGRASLHNRDGKTESGGMVSTWTLRSAPDLEARLRADFGIRLGHGEAARVWRRIAPERAAMA